jgi:glycerol-3-phosphate dehydrogenase subunit C
MSEGSLEAPVRHALDWHNPDFYDAEKLDAELRRVFDICHGCRRCFNLCDSFPRLFDLIDESQSGELDSVDSAGFAAVVDACTLCDMCFMTKCPYVPPHEFDLDFPHLMLRARAIEQRNGAVGFAARQMTQTDRNGAMARYVAPLANWALDEKNKLTRPLMEKAAGIHRDAALPKFHRKTLVSEAERDAPPLNRDAPAFGRKVVLYATCYGNYNNPEIGRAARAVLARNGVETKILHPNCCGMPQFEQGDLGAVADKAQRAARALTPWIHKGYDIIALMPSCALMLKFEWPLIVPEDPAVIRLSKATSDIAQYIVDIAKNEGIAEGLSPLDGGVTIHLACHARAQNMGAKAAQMMRLIPDSDIKVIERCSGHGGSWGVMKDNFETALKIGRPAMRQAIRNATKYVVSECPLAGLHLAQGIERLAESDTMPQIPSHPIVLFARAYGIAI